MEQILKDYQRETFSWLPDKDTVNFFQQNSLDKEIGLPLAYPISVKDFTNEETGEYDVDKAQKYLEGVFKQLEKNDCEILITKDNYNTYGIKPEELEDKTEKEKFIEVISNKLPEYIGGYCYNIFIKDITGATKILNIFIYNPYLNETMTKQTFYHEYCHTLQGKYYREYEDKIDEKLKNSQNQDENAWNEKFYIKTQKETEADLFGSICIMLKTLQNNPKELENVKQTLKENITFQILYRDRTGYFAKPYEAFPVVCDFIDAFTENSIKFKEKFLKDGKINIDEVYKYSSEKTLELNKTIQQSFDNIGTTWPKALWWGWGDEMKKWYNNPNNPLADYIKKYEDIHGVDTEQCRLFGDDKEFLNEYKNTVYCLKNEKYTNDRCKERIEMLKYYEKFNDVKDDIELILKESGRGNILE